jgi:hypothetical protein
MMVLWERYREFMSLVSYSLGAECLEELNLMIYYCCKSMLNEYKSWPHHYQHVSVCRTFKLRFPSSETTRQIPAFC